MKSLLDWARCQPVTPASKAHKSSPVANAICGFIDTKRKTEARRHLRGNLSWMDESLLDDVGVPGRDAVWIEASKTVVPRNWQDAPIARRRRPI